MNTSKKYFDIWKIVSLVVLGLYILFLLFPLFKLLQTAFVSKEGSFTLEQF
jgi:iron(III) transport system permease protein